MRGAGLELLIKVREKEHRPVPRGIIQGSSDGSHEALPGCWALPGSAIRPAASSCSHGLPSRHLSPPFPQESKLAPCSPQRQSSGQMSTGGRVGPTVSLPIMQPSLGCWGKHSLWARAVGRGLRGGPWLERRGFRGKDKKHVLWFVYIFSLRKSHHSSLSSSTENTGGDSFSALKEEEDFCLLRFF